MHDRRAFLKTLGLSSAGGMLSAVTTLSKDKIRRGSDETKREIADLKKAYEELDSRSKFIMRAILFFMGLDIFT